MGAHAKLAPSASHRWIACPGSVRLCVGVVGEDSVYAAEGTFAHDIAARCLKKGCQASDLIGERNLEFVVDDEMAEHIQTYLDVVRDLAFADQPAPFDSRWFTERKVKLAGLRDDISGTADAIVIRPRILHVVDFKYGAGVWVDVVNNPQLRIYALGVLLSLAGECAAVGEVHLHVVQPRHFRGGHSVEKLSREDLISWGRFIKKSAEETENPLAELAAGEHCRFCPAKAICPHLRDEARSYAKHLFGDAEFKTPAKTPPKPTALTAEQLSNALEAFPVIEKWISAVREHAYNEAAKGRCPPRHKLIDKTGHRQWNDSTTATLILEAIGVNPYAEPKLLSPAQAEKKIASVRRESVMKKLAHVPLRGTVLVPSSDKRPASKPGKVFGVVPSTK